MHIEILGSGCARCHSLEANVHKALQLLGKEAQVTAVTDMAQIMAYGVLSMPALVVDGKVLASGRVLSPEEVKRALVNAGI
ncbi:MAG: thioredoxin family protein [Candidatus Cryosericum sp.]|jgi:small redox-active disulfide protein 2|nr:thioredoxin family protein [Candidatus Cryosericum sp.]HPS70362.1 thioredoxin family protein [Candidatus Cryosericum sp.]